MSSGRAGDGEAGLRDEVVALARDLIRIDTSNPPGNETAAAELLRDYLGAAGIECELAGPDPRRLNLVARIAGRGEGPSLMLIAHTDVVPASPADWTVPPFEAVERDGRLIGRGAVDMKNELAARAVALAAFARSGVTPAGDVVLVAEADEERNTADVGMSWLVRERPDVLCDFAINEGGGTLLELANGRRAVTVSVGEKQVTSLRIRVRGRGGHASIPTAAENPLGHLGIAIERLLSQTAAPRITPALARALEAIGAPASGGGEVSGSSAGSGEAVAGASADDAEGLAHWAAGQHPVLADLMPAISRMTVTPTGTRTNEPANVIPSCADLICDCRALPGDREEDVRRFVASALAGEFDYELEFLEPLEGGTESPLDTRLYALLERYVAERVPGAELMPMVTPGFTDSHWIRAARGTVAYGFAPVLFGDPNAFCRAAHAADEAIEIDDLAEMAAFHLRAIREFTGPAA